MNNFLIANPCNKESHKVYWEALKNKGVVDIIFDEAVKPGSAIANGELAVKMVEVLGMKPEKTPPPTPNSDNCICCGSTMPKTTIKQIVAGVRTCNICEYHHVPDKTIADVIEHMQDQISTLEGRL